MSVRVQEQDFDVSAEIDALVRGATGIGAIATFIGKVRGEAHGSTLQSMTLEHYPGMTEEELARIETEAARRFKLAASLIVHRVGTLVPGDNIVLVITCSPHRGDAFQACEFLMDYLKTRAPFWKKETAGDGQGRWVDARESDDHVAGRWSKPQL
jgi:molybdopterin synthase catalytic subunit